MKTITSNKSVFYYLLGVAALLLALKVLSSSIFQDIVDFCLSFLPLIIILICSFSAYLKYKKNPENKKTIRKKTLINILQFLIVTLLFYILYSPKSFTPYLSAFESIAVFFTMESYFFILTYLSLTIIALAGIKLSAQLYLKSQGIYKGSIRKSIHNSLIALFFIFFLLLASSASAFPQAYAPLKEYGGNLIYNLALRKDSSSPDNLAHKRITSVKEAFSQTYQNLKGNISQSNRKFTTNIKDTKDTLDSAITITAKDLKNNLAEDIDDKLNLGGGTITGDLTLEDNLKTKDTAYMEDILPQEDNAHDLGSVSQGWENLYIHRLYGSSPIIIGGADSSHSLDDSNDLIVSGELEVNGTVYLDSAATLGDILNLNNYRITNLAEPTDDQDAVTKNYADNLVGAAAFIQRNSLTSTIYPTNSGDSWDMLNGIISNIGNANTDFTSTGGLNLAGNLNLSGLLVSSSAGAHTLGPVTFTNGDITGITDLTSDAGTIATLASTTITTTTTNTTTLDLGTNTIKDGNLTGSWNFNSGDLSGIGTITADEVRARSPAGLKLYDDGGSGIFVEDEGNVGIGTESPDYKLSVSGGDIVLVNNGGDPAVVAMDSLNDYMAMGWDSAGDYGAIQTKQGGSLGGSLALQQSGGNVGIGETSPTAYLHIKAGTAAVGTAPLKLTSGALNTTAEAGAVEFLTDGFYGTVTTAAVRQQFATDLNTLTFTNKTLSTGSVWNGTVIEDAYLTKTGAWTGTLDTFEGADFLRSNASDEFTTGNTLTLTGSLDSNGEVSIADTTVLFDGASADFGFTGDWTVNTDDLVILEASGHIGINTTGPDARLDILDASNPQMRLTQTDTTYVADFQVDSSGDLTIDPSGGDVIVDGNVVADSFTGPSGQSVTITMTQEGSCTESTDGSEVGDSTSCAQKEDKSRGWAQTNRFQYYEGYAGYNLDCNSDGDKTDWCDSGYNATAEVGDSVSSWNQAGTASLTLTASTVKGAVKYTWTMYADWNGNGNFDGHSASWGSTTQCPSDHNGGCFLEEMWPKDQWTEDYDGDTDGVVGSGDQTWMGIDLNNTYNGGADPDPSDRIVHFNMPTVAAAAGAPKGRVVITVKARDPHNTVLASGSLTIDPKGVPDISQYAWSNINDGQTGEWSSVMYGDQTVNTRGMTYTAFHYVNKAIKYTQDGDDGGTAAGRADSSYGVSYQDAVRFCNDNNARLMTIAELKQVNGVISAQWPTSYVWSLSLYPNNPRHRLLLGSDGRVNHSNVSERYSDNGVLCAQ